MNEEGEPHTGIQLPGALDSKKVICGLQNKQLISTSIAVVHPFWLPGEDTKAVTVSQKLIHKLVLVLLKSLKDMQAY